MNRGFQLGRLFGTDIYVSPLFFALPLYYSWNGSGIDIQKAALFALVLLVSILVHEFGHVFAVRKLLHARSVVVLWMLGGLTYHPGTANPGKRIAISLTGPAFGLVLGGAAWLVGRSWTPPSQMFAAGIGLLAWVNLVWTGLNLLPIVPLDGGQALAGALELALSPRRAKTTSLIVSMATCGAGIAAALHFGWPYAALLAGYFLFMNLRVLVVPYHGSAR